MSPLKNRNIKGHVKFRGLQYSISMRSRQNLLGRVREWFLNGAKRPFHYHNTIRWSKVGDMDKTVIMTMMMSDNLGKLNIKMLHVHSL